MKTPETPLPQDTAELQELVLAYRTQLQTLEHQYQTKLQALEKKYQTLLEQFRLSQHKRFGASSEAHPGQGQLFNEAEAEVAQAEEAPEAEDITTRRPKRKGRPALPPELPRERVEHDLPEQDKNCDCCGEQMHRMGEETREKLEFVPARVKVIEHVRFKYACRTCEREGTQGSIRQAPAEPALIPKSFATPGLLAQIITSKFQYGLPLYRQETMFNQLGITLSRRTMSTWMLKVAEAAAPLLDRFKQEMLRQDALHADETRLRVLEDERSISYMWVYCSGTDGPREHGPPNIVLFDYQQGSRSAHCPIRFLDGFSGYLHVDGYAGYEKTQATLVGCLAHVRRYFTEAKQAQPKGKTGRADLALSHIRKLYRIETALKDATPEERFHARYTQALPLMQEFRRWLDASALQVPPKTALGKAVHYALKQWPKLMLYLSNGTLSIDNNRAERVVRPFAVGRKNWLFSNTHNGASASAALFSLVETAKANGLPPFDYLSHVVKELPGLASGQSMDHLLPWKLSLSDLDTG